MAVRTANDAFAFARNGQANVLDYGAVGDGSTDDAPAIATAIAALPTRGGVLVFPPAVGNSYGRYVIDSTITLRPGITIRGINSTVSRIVFGSSAGVGFEYDAASLTEAGIVIQDMGFECETYSPTVLRFEFARNLVIDRCRFEEFCDTGILLESCRGVSIRDCEFNGTFDTAAIYASGTSNVFVSRCYIQDDAGDPIILSSSSDVVIVACDVVSNTTFLRLINAENIVVDGNAVEYGYSAAIYGVTTASNRVTIRNNRFVGAAPTRVLEFNSSSLAHGRFVIASNNFTGLGSGDYCYAPGSTTVYEFFQNQKDAGTYVEGSASGTVRVDVP